MSLNKFADSEVELRRIGGANAPVGSRDTISCAVELLRLVTSDNTMTSLLKKLSISIKMHVVKPVCLFCILSTKSVGSRRELVASCVHTADANATQLRIRFYSAISVTAAGILLNNFDT